MHAFYSYQLFKDGDYEYNPMMHGPFQFHRGNALMYYFFGVSDATSRYLAATFGILTVILAMLLGPFLGPHRHPFSHSDDCLFAQLYVFLDRFTRVRRIYDWCQFFTMVVFLFKFYQSRQNIDLWLATVGFTIAFCTKGESIFLTLAVMGTYLFLRLLPWADIFIAGGGLTSVGVLSQLILPKDTPVRLPFFFGLLSLAFLYTVYQPVVHALAG